MAAEAIQRGEDRARAAEAERLRTKLLPRARRVALDPGEVCTQIYGGPENITVTGLVEGDPVTAVVTRVNGCEIARYDLLTKALAAG